MHIRHCQSNTVHIVSQTEGYFIVFRYFNAKHKTIKSANGVQCMQEQFPNQIGVLKNSISTIPIEEKSCECQIEGTTKWGQCVLQFARLGMYVLVR